MKNKIIQTAQQENYINSRLEAYRAELEEKDSDWIEGKVGDALAEAEEKERERLEYEEPSLRGAAYEAHMKKFLKDTENELYEYYKAECDKENDRLVEEYRKELEHGKDETAVNKAKGGKGND